MKPIIFCGYSGTGKTTFIKKAAKGLAGRGYRVGYVKHSRHFKAPELHAPEGIKDTETLLESGVIMASILSDGMEVTYRVMKGGGSKKSKAARWENLTGKRLRRKVRELIERFSEKGSGAENINIDYLLIEGFKDYDGPVAKVLFGKSRENIVELKRGLAVAYSGRGVTDYRIDGLEFLPDDTGEEELADFIERNSVEFPADLDCGECGFSTCREFADRMLAGEATIEGCPPLGEKVVLTIDGRRVMMKGFVRKTLRDVVLAYVGNLHDTAVKEMSTVQLTIKSISTIRSGAEKRQPDREQ